MGEESVMPYFVDNFGYWILFNEKKFFGPIFCISALTAAILCRNKKIVYCFVSYVLYFVVNVCIYYVVREIAGMYAIMPRTGFGWNPLIFKDAVDYVSLSGINIFIIKIIYDIITKSKIEKKKTMKVLISILYAIYWNVIILLEYLLVSKIF